MSRGTVQLAGLVRHACMAGLARHRCPLSQADRSSVYLVNKYKELTTAVNKDGVDDGTKAAGLADQAD